MYEGYVLSAQIEGLPSSYGYAGRDVMAGSMDNCRSMISDKIMADGYYDVQINSMNLDRDSNQISGFAQANRSNHPQWFSFSCMLDPASGDVLVTSVIRR